MNSYRLFFLKNGTPASDATIAAHDDNEACRIVERMERAEAVEVWREGKRLRTIFPVPRPALTE